MTDPAITVRGELVPSEIGAVDLARRGSLLALGAVALGLRAMVVGLSRSLNSEAAPAEPGLVANAALGLALESQRLAFNAVDFGTQSARTVGRALGKLPLVRESVRGAVGVLEPWSERGIEGGLRARAEAQDLIDAVIPRVGGAFVERIDLDAVVDQIDLTGIISDSTSGIAGESLDTVRLQSVRLDNLASRIVDAVLRRKGGRKLPER